MKQDTRTSYLFFWSCLLGFFLLSSCGVQRYLPPDKYLFAGAELKVVAADSVRTQNAEQAGRRVLQQQVSPPWRVWWHYQNSFMLRWLGQRIGRAPVFYDAQRSRQLTQLLENRAANEGHFFRQSSFVPDTNSRKQRISVSYQLRVGPGYSLDTVIYRLRDSALQKKVMALADETLLRPGESYQLAGLKSERQRIAAALRRQGHYYFTAQDLEYLADTMGNDRGVRLLLKLNDGVPPQHLVPQRIRRIAVQFDQRGSAGEAEVDTTQQERLTIIGEGCPLRQDILVGAFALEPGSRYSPEAHERTVERLASYNMFRYISISYEAVAGADSLLDAQVFLSPNFRRTVSGEVGAAWNSGRYLGPEFAIRYINRNLFKGAEWLTLDGDFTYNFFLGDQRESRIPRSGIYSLTASLQVPRFWWPRQLDLLPDFRQSTTSITLNGKLETLALNLSRFADEIDQSGLTDLSQLLAGDDQASARVTLWQYSGQYRYNWKLRPTITHQLAPLNLRYQNPQVVTEDLLTLSRSLGFTQGQEGLGRLDRMFLFGPSYRYVYDSRVKGFRWHHFFSSVGLALNFNQVLPIGQNQRELVRENSHYLQPELDLRYYGSINRQLTVAVRLHAGAAIPFTERAIVPYFDLYTVGGPNSLRGFIPRGLGPGITVPLESNSLGQNGFGNVLFESSLEVRQRFLSTFELAAFVDAGNVWLYRTETVPTIGDFRWSRFRNELAANVGLGFRLDLSFLLLRLDVAKPVRIPYETDPDTPPDRSLRLVLAFGHPF